jgi:hypothetical protein
MRTEKRMGTAGFRCYAQSALAPTHAVFQGSGAYNQMIDVRLYVGERTRVDRHDRLHENTEATLNRAGLNSENYGIGASVDTNVCIDLIKIQPILGTGIFKKTISKPHLRIG